MGSQEKNEDKIELDLESLANKLTNRVKTRSLFSEAQIYRVPKDLRQVKEGAYTPRLIAIGPLHHGKEGLKKPMDDVKFYYTYYLLDRLVEGTWDEVIEKILGKLKECATKVGECVKTAKKYYAEEVKFKDEEMAEMMLFDGCFILELLYASYIVKIKKEAEKRATKGGDSGNSKASLKLFVSASNSIVLQPRDPILDNILIANIVKHDLLLFENQITFFVLENLFKLTVDKIPDDKIPGGKKLSLKEYVVSYFGNILSPEGDNSVSEKKTGCCLPSECVLWVCGGSTKEIEQKKKEPWKANHEEYDHILHLLHDYYGPGVRAMENKQNSAKVPCAWPLTTTCPCCTPPKKFSALEVRASELHYRGVKFAPSQGNSLFDVKFKKPKGICWLFHRATFEIPTVVINDSKEIFLRNLIAYEQFRGISPELRYFTTYANLIDVLINSETDVKVLSKANVIRNFLGTDEDVSELLNNLCKEVVVGSFFEDACQQAFVYSQRLWPRFMAYWIRTYVASPWAFIGFCLALIAFGIQITSFTYSFLK